MLKVEYLDPEIANEGSSADAPVPMEPAHVFDYAPLRTHKTYAKYFAPHTYQRYPAIFYHKNGEQRIVATHDEASELAGVRPVKGGWVCDGDWFDTESDAHPVKPAIDGAGKSLVAASASQVAGGTNEIMAQILQKLTDNGVPSNKVVPAIAAAMAEDKEYQDYLAFKRMRDASLTADVIDLPADDQKAILIELAKEKGIKLDKRWGLDTIKAELDKFGDAA